MSGSQLLLAQLCVGFVHEPFEPRARAVAELVGEIACRELDRPKGFAGTRGGGDGTETRDLAIDDPCSDDGRDLFLELRDLAKGVLGIPRAGF